MNRIIMLLVAAAAASPLAAQDSTQAAAPAASALTLSAAVVARSVVDRVPQDTGSTFPADVGQLVCFTEVQGAATDAPATIHHVWFHGETQVADVSLEVRGSPWRTWSRKTVPADWTGPWRIEIRDDAGTVLKRIDFTVGP